MSEWSEYDTEERHRRQKSLRLRSISLSSSVRLLILLCRAHALLLHLTPLALIRLIVKKLAHRLDVLSMWPILDRYGKMVEMCREMNDFVAAK